MRSHPRDVDKMVSTWSDDGHFHASHRDRLEPDANAHQRQRRTTEEKRQIVEETLVEGCFRGESGAGAWCQRRQRRREFTG